MDSYVLKTEALCWLRFGKKMLLVCTEGGSWSADVLGLADDHSVEIEVKVSKSDLKREFLTKAHKHYVYNLAEHGVGRQVPNYFYFYVPPELETDALKIIEAECPKAGLAVYDPTINLDGRKTRVTRRATKLHDRAPSQHFKNTVLRRMGSELCGRYVVQAEHHTQTMDALRRIDLRLVDTIKRMTETPDAEEANEAGNP